MKPTPLDYFASLISQKPLANPLIHNIAIDSRLIGPGGLFFALRGQQVDGHDFLKDVAAKGANAALVRDTYDGDHFGLILIKVPYVLKALQEMAAKALQERSTKVIAITGSIGKTTTKEFIKSFLETRYKVFASPKSYNTESTLPLNILMADGDEDFIVLEMGMSRPGDIEELISIAPPDIALLTTCALQHSINFPNGLIDITREKATIFSHPKTQLGFLHRDLTYFSEAEKMGICPKITFSTKGDEADYFLTFIARHKARIISLGESYDIPYHLPAKFFAHNLLASVAVARACDVSWEDIQKTSLTIKLPQMRFEKIEKKGIIFINDAYNANPDSMKAALESLPQPEKQGKRIAVLTEMNALGDFSDECHSSVAEMALNCADILLSLGKKAHVMHKIWKDHRRDTYHCETKEELLATLKRIVNSGDVVLLKGARAYCLDKFLDYF